MPDIDQQVREIKAKIEVAQRTRFRAEADRDAAEVARSNALAKLKEDYGVSTVDEAKAVMADMRAELDELISQTRQSLNELNL